MRTLLPHFFTDWNIKTDFASATEPVWTILLPKLTDEHYRVEVVKFNNVPLHPSQNMEFFRSTIVLSEYIRAHDYMNGFLVIVDISEVKLVDILPKINLMYLRQALSIYIEGYGMRVKSIHLVTTSKVLDTLLAVIKQVMSPKIAGRVHIHKTMDEINEFVPKRILPKDYGGEERSIKELYEEWLEVLTSDDHIKYMRDINEARTDEVYRQSDKFNEQCAGMPGTFRLLSID
ncbi:alpha-tocopherol transfer protein-like [Melitaea cinxia]|uniref:alpha-tocopherol transfer protein-like n=1 Tax=Melitaea cinxia TaxID=113334 RepID=UPI001E273C31|nr:alpha-tocopherol transfer protein-like [Melitaea cinxia]